MRINVDRLCELAGVPGARRTRNGLLRESRYDEEKEVEAEEGMHYEGMYEDDKEKEEMMHYEGMYEDDKEKEEGMGHDDEVLEVDEKDLVKELRRMKVKMHEARKAKRRRQQNLQETQLKAIIDQEVKNVLKELNLNSGWMYGKKKPQRSRKGYTHQGSFLKGIGFR